MNFNLNKIDFDDSLDDLIKIKENLNIQLNDLISTQIELSDALKIVSLQINELLDLYTYQTVLSKDKFINTDFLNKGDYVTYEDILFYHKNDKVVVYFNDFSDISKFYLNLSSLTEDSKYSTANLLTVYSGNYQNFLSYIQVYTIGLFTGTEYYSYIEKIFELLLSNDDTNYDLAKNIIKGFEVDLKK